MIIFLEKLFGFMDILHSNKQKNKTIITQKKNIRKKLLSERKKTKEI
jgi:hypothetical protein